jgi:hypothetical protein
MTPRALSLSFLLLLGGPAPAQIGLGEVGFQIVTQAGEAGTLCARTFSCAPLPATALRGEQTTLVVRGVRNQPFAVMVGLTTQSLCLPFPGIHNALAVTPLFVPFAGSLTQQDTIRVCPGGIERMPLTIPLELPAGSAFLLQALAWSYLAPAEVPTFTNPIQVRVQ